MQTTNAKSYAVQPKVGIVGLGGFGHSGVKFARAFGANVVLLTTSPGREALAKVRAVELPVWQALDIALDK